MSIVQVRAVRCDHEGCSEALIHASNLDAFSARMASALEGWTYRQPTKGISDRRTGKRVGSADFCPEHSKETS